ncbi:thiamine biosynthesis protein thio [Francisella tularensis subsp. novicida]|uniref:FAD-dependent oxidoreductase n=1 Tax=Francisella tularensis TaxID=263 RepID=UPI000CE2A78A|nr:FAD-dependent oxidoreductase [Francisella tularensis]AVC44044.1 thiamine biosynthesis protein thio [Francisella tularensis subsp. novicida]
MSRVAILGSGVMGRVLGLYLLKLYPNLKIDIYTNSLDYKTSCSYCAGGMLAPITELISCQKHIYKLGLNSFELWRELNMFINENLDRNTSFVRKINTCVIAHNQDRSELDLAIRNIDLRLKNLNIRPFIDICSIEKVRAINKGLSLSNTLYEKALITNEALIDVPKFFELTQELFLNLQDVRIFETTKEQFYQERFDNVYEHIFDCTGISSDGDIKLYGVRGESILLESKNIKLDSIIRFLHPRHSIYLIPRDDGIFYLGATSIDSNDYSKISVQSTLELLSMLVTVDKRFLEARILKTLTNVRPMSIDDKPIISTKGNITYLNGLSRHGYLFSPMVAQTVIKNNCDFGG